MDNTIPLGSSHDNPQSKVTLPATSGIYKITCVANGRIYIGSATNLRQRKNMHIHQLRQNKHGNRHLQRAWNKYGEQAFTFEVLELVLPISLTAREQYWFKRLRPFGRKGFNILTEAGSNLGKKMSPEAIEKTRQANLGRKRPPEAIERTRQAHLGSKRLPAARAKMSAWQQGRNLSPEHIEHMRQAVQGQKRSPETRERMSQAQRGKKCTPTQIEAVKRTWTGRKHTPETLEKMQQAHLGKKLSPEHVETIRQSHLGVKHSPERIEKMRQARWGKKARNEDAAG